MDTDKITSAGADGCPLNAGSCGGIITWLEKELGWRLNMLGPRHLIADLDGGTSSSSAFVGPIGGDDLEDMTEEAERDVTSSCLMMSQAVLKMIIQSDKLVSIEGRG